MSIDPLSHPACLETPLWLEESAWTQHLPFAMFAVSALKPRVIVELGAFRGTSYCAFCQAVASTGAGTLCFAVDTWKGDGHSGELEVRAFDRLKAHHDPLYSGFSRLLRKTFDEALEDIDDRSVDLLHIDGFHSYEAVSHDFRTWLPKLSDRAVVLFHDTEVRERDFGVWRFWEEVKPRYPNFEFHHGHGLGVLAVGPHVPEGVKDLFSAPEEERVNIRRLFRGLGMGVEGEPLITAASEGRRGFIREHIIDTLPVNSILMLFREGPAEFLRRAPKRLSR
jgi:hypothetical protein